MAFKYHNLVQSCSVVLAACSLAACDETVDASRVSDPDPVGRFLIIDTSSGVIAIDSAKGQTWHLVNHGAPEEGPVLRWEEIGGR